MGFRGTGVFATLTALGMGLLGALFRRPVPTPLGVGNHVVLHELPHGRQLTAGDLWAHQPVVVMVTRRPGCLLCREEAAKLHNKKPELDALGIGLAAVVKENLPPEIAEFQKYWPVDLYWDVDQEFYQALGGGQPFRHNLFSFLLKYLSPFSTQLKANIARSTNAGFKGNLVGEGFTSGGLYVFHRGGEVAYSFLEKEIGDHAPLEEVLEVCRSVAGDSHKSAKS
eukprot:GGOE01042505.1.p2 GENE.GGOE01042505.1~~GGOE01042505.1.p2  ORF type:complete len:225 (+),score=57.24 GGOE01042505.1:39-713(+)